MISGVIQGLIPDLIRTMHIYPPDANLIPAVKELTAPTTGIYVGRFLVHPHLTDIHATYFVGIEEACRKRWQAARILRVFIIVWAAEDDWSFGFERDIHVYKDAQKRRAWCLDFDKEVYMHCAHMALNASDERVPVGGTVLDTQAARGLEFEIWREALNHWEPFDPRDVWGAYPGMFFLIRRRGMSLGRLGDFEGVRKRLKELSGLGCGPLLRDPERWDADVGGETLVEESDPLAEEVE